MILSKSRRVKPKNRVRVKPPKGAYAEGQRRLKQMIKKLQMKSYKIYGDDEDWYNFSPNWCHLKTVKANSPSEAIRKVYDKKMIHRSWRLSDLKARLVRKKK